MKEPVKDTLARFPQIRRVFPARGRAKGIIFEIHFQCIFSVEH